jgi:hypothetical protein
MLVEKRSRRNDRVRFCVIDKIFGIQFFQFKKFSTSLIFVTNFFGNSSSRVNYAVNEISNFSQHS